MHLNVSLCLNKFDANNDATNIYENKTRCKNVINLSFTPFFTLLVTPNVTPWLAILPTLVSVVNATFVMHKTTVYKQTYAV